VLVPRVLTLCCSRRGTKTFFSRTPPIAPLPQPLPGDSKGLFFCGTDLVQPPPCPTEFLAPPHAVDFSGQDVFFPFFRFWVSLSARLLLHKPSDGSTPFFSNLPLLTHSFLATMQLGMRIFKSLCLPSPQASRYFAAFYDFPLFCVFLRITHAQAFGVLFSVSLPSLWSCCPSFFAFFCIFFSTLFPLSCPSSPLFSCNPRMVGS